MTRTVEPEPPWYEAVLDFWFHEVGPNGWFGGGEPIDAATRSRFIKLHSRLLAGEPVEESDPRQVVAAVIVLDQFSRNMFRGTPQAYAADAVARRLARAAVARGLDDRLGPAERMFLYLPFEHSEDRADQALSVELFARLGNDQWLRYAAAHKAIIDRFGRFPHRNAILGRVSTAEELALLERPMGSF